ncbi:hypothetical protein C3L55_07045 [Veillonellaceae bacterium M1-70]|nr:hypothetical protein [Veillonellaceae bacterium M1-70]
MHGSVRRGPIRCRTPPEGIPAACFFISYKSGIFSVRTVYKKCYSYYENKSQINIGTHSVGTREKGIKMA